MSWCLFISHLHIQALVNMQSSVLAMYVASTHVGNVICQDFKMNSYTNKIRVWDCQTGFWVTRHKHKGNVCPIGRLL